MGHMINFHLHLPHLLHHHHSKHEDHHHHHPQMKGVPKGCMAVMVGHEGEEQLQRFVIPIVYINHPLFLQLLKEAEEEYGFVHKGPITIPCHVEQFRYVQELIDREQNHHQIRHQVHHHDRHQFNHHEQDHHFLCFKA